MKLVESLVCKKLLSITEEAILKQLAEGTCAENPCPGCPIHRVPEKVGTA
jgi:hypothetical protein